MPSFESKLAFLPLSPAEDVTVPRDCAEVISTICRMPDGRKIRDALRCAQAKGRVDAVILFGFAFLFTLSANPPICVVTPTVQGSLTLECAASVPEHGDFAHVGESDHRPWTGRATSLPWPVDARNKPFVSELRPYI